MAAGGTVAWWLAGELGARRPIFAALVPLVAMTGDPFAAVSVSISRIVGVFAGVGIGIAVVHLHIGLTLRVALALLLGALASVVLKVGDRPNLEVPIAALFLLGFASAHISQLGIQRIWETGVGAGVAIVIASLVWPPDPLRALTRQLGQLRVELIRDLAAIADDLATGSGETAARLDEVRAHSLDAVREVFELDAAKRSLRWNPLRKRDADAVAELAVRIELAARVYRHARALARDVSDVDVRDERLASATRDLADATDRALTKRAAGEPLDRARTTLAERFDGEAWLVAAQLRQLHTDVVEALKQGDIAFTV
jgi:uncharacterized membrane protein YgaE (UPF0421/DUF939 family)